MKFASTYINTIRNFVVIAHIDHGKSTLADRFLEVTHTVEARNMKPQLLDQMDLERERGITIKMQPVRMVYHPDHRHSQTETQTNAEFLYGELTYKIRGVLFRVRKKIGLGHKEQVYQNALEIEFKSEGIKFESKKNISLLYEGKSIGIYQPDFVVDDKILIELKALPEIGKPQIEQVWSYLKGCNYKLALLVNFGSKDLEIKRIVYDTARGSSAFSALSQPESAGVVNQIEDYVLNLIDTPGHIDFSYEVSRALAAVEGAILLVDATQGVQAQTLTNLHIAQKEGLTIIPAVNKIDAADARVPDVVRELAELIACPEERVACVSARTGAGVLKLLERVIREVPPPSLQRTSGLRALIFDSKFESHRGIIAYVRVFEGEIKRGDKVYLYAAKMPFEVKEVGEFKPFLTSAGALHAGEIGYIITGIKNTSAVRIGDTVMDESQAANSSATPLPGYAYPQPVVWANFYPEEERDFEALRDALSRLQLNDAAFRFEPESSPALGRSFACGFLGMLHLEIVTERLRREFSLSVVTTSPSIAYEVTRTNGAVETVSSASKFPPASEIQSVREPWITAEIITPDRYFGNMVTLIDAYEGRVCSSEPLSAGSPGVENASGMRIKLMSKMPLREIVSDFFDKLKSATAGYASFSYEHAGLCDADVERIDMYVAGDPVIALSRIVSRDKASFIARSMVESLKEVLPRQLFQIKIQAIINGRIVASESLAALKKDVTGYLYGGDRSRKMKLWKKQKAGKKRLKAEGKVHIPPEAFLSVLKKPH